LQEYSFMCNEKTLKGTLQVILAVQTFRN